MTDRRAAVVGIGQTEFSKDSGRSELHLACEASRRAIVDAGLAAADIDGTVTFTLDTNDELALIRSLGIPELSWASRTPFGGAGASATLQQAAAAVTSGAADAVLVYRAFNERSGHRFGQPMQRPPSARTNLHEPYGLLTPPQVYALWYQRYMHAYGVTNADFGMYSVIARRNAATNPNAWFYNRPITIDDHQNSRWIVEPVLRLLDCCQESDGGVALVVTSTDRARDLRHPSVTIEAAAQSSVVDGDMSFNYYAGDLTRFAEAENAAERMWRSSGLGPADMDVALIYENSSPVVFYQLEAFGFCGPGEARDFIAEGHIGLTGTIPVNPHGGLLGEAYIHGMNNIVEAVRQLRGTAANQVLSPQHALVSAGRSAAILSRD
ncbi:MAG: lipid-transfer protein [Actinomycetota bacterium]|nr:lipid-transfer protein [Actinomycetota bacterium]